MRVGKDLYKAGTKELIRALRKGGITENNVSSHTRIYEAKDGSIKATNDLISDLREGGKVESIGFWLWISYQEYKKAMEGTEGIHEEIAAGFKVNLMALKKLLKG